MGFNDDGGGLDACGVRSLPVLCGLRRSCLLRVTTTAALCLRHLVLRGDREIALLHRVLNNYVCEPSKEISNDNNRHT